MEYRVCPRPVPSRLISFISLKHTDKPQSLDLVDDDHKHTDSGADADIGLELSRIHYSVDTLHFDLMIRMNWSKRLLGGRLYFMSGTGRRFPRLVSPSPSYLAVSVLCDYHRIASEGVMVFVDS